ncbi:MAG: argininosuccinate lyase [Armatimonadota bacterium]|nr:MAG: argininosuccinate lyase [Armatimonadota bacterium]
MRLWGGRFSKDPDQLAHEFTRSLPFDQRLAEHDIAGSIAHVRMLGHCAVLTPGEARKIEAGLERVRAGLSSGELTLDPESEDIHTEIERLLIEQVGAVAGKLHTARSRNDQIALDLRLFVREEIDSLRDHTAALQRALVEVAEKHLDTVMPGYTHLQRAQPVLLAHHLMAYFFMVQRDRDRLAECRKRVDLCPLGAAALAGTSFPIDPSFVAKQLGFDGLCPNSIDAVSDRDFILEFLADAAIAAVHLSQLAAEIVLWSSTEFGFVRLDDAWCTGSSIMPQKRNPDGAELTRGKAGRVFGNLMNLLSVLKGLPLAYNRDLQEDKEALFDTADTVSASLRVMRGMVTTASFDTQRMADALSAGFPTATGVADYLVRAGLPFREAHGIAGQIVQYCEKEKIGFEQLSVEEWRSFSAEFGEDIVKRISPGGAVAGKVSPGGTAPPQVKDQIARARKLLES